MGLLNKPGFSGCRRLSGGAGRTRTNHQSVMEHGLSPTNSPGRTPLQIIGVVVFPFILAVGRTRTMFHNTLVVGSSPTSSTTEPPATGESRLVHSAPFFIGRAT